MDFEIRSNDCIFLSGYVNAVERRSKILTRAGAPPFREFVRPGTFQKSLNTGSKVSLMLNHDRVICDTESGLELREDSIGLYAKAKISDEEVVRAAKEKKLTGWSFGFLCIKDQWSKDEGGLELRELEDIRLEEVSILTGKPAYLATSVEIREGSGLLERRCGEGEIKIIDKRIDYFKFDADIEILKLGGHRYE